MVKVGLFVRIEAKPEKEAAVEELLRGAVARAQQEDATIFWFGLRLGPTTFAVFDAFVNEEGRDAHLAANSEALRAKAAELFATAPSIECVDIVAAKLPAVERP